jgi:hypothetical protein
MLTLPNHSLVTSPLGPWPLEDSLHLLDDAGPVFIMGCPRSGTTVLADSFQHLPNTLVKVGVLSPDRLMHLFGSEQLPPPVEEHLLWIQRQIFWRAFLEMHDSRMCAFRDALRTRNWKLLRRHRWPLAEFLFVYKEPFLSFACEQFARHFTRSKFIHTIRDGRDCADSMVRTYPHALRDEVLRDRLLWRLKGSEIGVARSWNEWHLPWWLPEGAEEEFLSLMPFGRYVWMWQEMVRRGKVLAEQLGPERVFELRYEEFCERPQEVGQRTAAFLGVPFSRSFERFLRTVTTRSVGCHRTQSPEVLAEAERVGAPLLEELGYI